MPHSHSVLRKRDVIKKTKLSDSTIARYEKKGRFPRRFRVTDTLVGWLESEVDDWVKARAHEREAIEADAESGDEEDEAEADATSEAA